MNRTISTTLHLFVFAAVLAMGISTEVAAQNSAQRFKGDYHLETKPSRRVKLVLEGALHTPSFNPSAWIIVLPEVPNHAWQKVESQAFRLIIDKGEQAKVKVTPLDAPDVVGCRVQRLVYQPTKPSSSVRYVYEVEATLNEVRLEKGRGRTKPPTLSRREGLSTLAARSPYDFEAKPFQAYLSKHKLKINRGERDLEFAYRVLAHIHEKYTYRYPPKFGTRLATEVCVEGASDCGGLSILFSTVMRANGIPARVLGGQWALLNKPNDPQYHVRAEFWAKGVGWVPIDGSGAVQWKGAPGSAFGTQRPQFFVMHQEVNLEVDTLFFGKKPILFLQSPACWVRGSGKFAGIERKATWRVEDLPLRK